MSWSIYAIGRKGHVLKTIQRHTATADPDQYEPAKALILGEVERIKGGPDQVISVEASGSLDTSSGSRQLNIKLTTQVLPKEPEAEPGNTFPDQ